MTRQPFIFPVIYCIQVNPSPPPLCITLPIASYESKKTIGDIRMWLFLNLPGHNEKDFIALGIIKVDSNSTQRLKITLIF